MGFFLFFINMYHLISIFFILQITMLFSQSITSIDIQGNKKTKDYIILREIQQKVNDELDLDILNEDKNRIYNLGLFSNVEIDIVEDSNDDYIYMITVNEMWYIWPSPIIEYDNKSERFSYGGAITHNNIRGKDENIAMGATFGNIKEYFLWYENPWISGNHNSLEMEIYLMSFWNIFYKFYPLL